jgi:6-phosphofructokinase 1
MNAATRTAARYCLSRGHTPLGIYNGWPGLLEDNVSELTWLRVDQWTVRGGSELGTNRKQPDIDLEGIAYKLEEHKIDALLVIGGFEAFSSLLDVEKARASYRKFKIPMIHLPATISNNVPVTDWSLGSDTSINVLVEACDSIKQSASASRNRVFVVETQGGECGYISVVGALAVSVPAVLRIHARRY